MIAAHKISHPCKTLAILAMIGLMDSTGFASDPNDHFSFTHEEIRGFKPDKLKSIIKSALEYRIDQCRNIYYDVETRYGLCDFGELVSTDFTKPFTFERVQCWVIGNSFRVDKERRDWGGIPNYIRNDAFDAREGIVKYYGMDHPSGGNKYGAIDSKITTAPFTHTYIYWLNLPDQHQYAGEFFVRKIVANFNNWQIRILPTGLIDLQCNWKLALNNNVVGKITYTLDPMKGFLPIACYGMWKDPNAATSFHQYELRFVVEESKIVSGLWMPTKVRDAISVNGTHDEGNLYITTVKVIELGKTKETDVRLSFPEGTSVQDRIKGVVFTVGPNEAKREVEKLYLTDPTNISGDESAGSRQTSNKYRILVVLCNAVAIGILAYVIMRRRHLRSA